MEQETFTKIEKVSINLGNLYNNIVDKLIPLMSQAKIVADIFYVIK